jgi:CspA family cold shock protein
MNVIQGTVSEWHDEEGWGVLDSPDTPGGCFTHFSMVEIEGYRTLTVGQAVEFEWIDDQCGQDGYAFRAVTVRPLQ